MLGAFHIPNIMLNPLHAMWHLILIVTQMVGLITISQRKKLRSENKQVICPKICRS